MVHPLLAIFRLRQKSLPRALLLSLGAFAASLRLAGFPDIQNLHGSNWQFVALLFAALGHGGDGPLPASPWSLYHAGILILLYADLMILAMIVFLVGLSHSAVIALFLLSQVGGRRVAWC